MLTLALGIGATTAIFSVVYSVLIKPLPYPNADELVRIRHSHEGRARRADFEPTMYLTYRDENRTFADIGLWQDGVRDARRTAASRSACALFESRTARCRRSACSRCADAGSRRPSTAPRPKAQRRSFSRHAFWQRRFGGDEAASGATSTIDSRPAEVVGIMPRDFRFLDLTPQPDVIVAVRLDRANQVIALDFGYHGSRGSSRASRRPRLVPTLSACRPIWRDAWPLRDPGATREVLESIRDRPRRSAVEGRLRRRRREHAVGAHGRHRRRAARRLRQHRESHARAGGRAAAGIRHTRRARRSACAIARALLVESLVLGAAGSVLGLVLAYGGLQVLVAIGPSNLPRLQEIAVYPPVLAFTVAVSLASTLLFGSITALKHALHIDTPLDRPARGSSASRERNAARNTLVVVQVALALVLVVSAALMIRTFQALRDVDPGFSEPATIQTARIWIPRRSDSAIRSNSRACSARSSTRSRRFRASRQPALRARCRWRGRMQQRTDRDRRRNAGAGSGSADARHQVRLARVLRSDGHAHHRGTRHDLERHRSRRPRRRDLRELRSRARGRARGRARQTRPAPSPRRMRGARSIGVVQGVHETGLYEDAPASCTGPCSWRTCTAPRCSERRPSRSPIRSERAGTASFMDEVRQAILVSERQRSCHARAHDGRTSTPARSRARRSCS